MSSSDRKKDQKKTFKKLVSEYQREGYNSKEAKKYASQEVEEFMIEKKFKPQKRKNE
jgi:hypothetical protein